MRRLTTFARVLAVAFGLFQAGTPSLLALTESSYVGTRADASHVEDQTGRNCVPVHAADCAVCRVLTASAPLARPELLGCEAHPITAPRENTDEGLGRVASVVTQSRAPPTL